MTVAPTISGYVPPGLKSDLGTISKESSRFDRTKPYDPDERPGPLVNLRVNVKVREAKTRLEFKAIVRSDPLTANTCQADIERYVFQLRYTNGAGVPQEQDDESKNVIHTKRIDAKEVFDSDNDEPHVAFQDLTRPKTWYIQARGRLLDKHHRKSDWTAWTSPVLPFQVAMPKPPAPTITDLDFLKDAGNRETKYEGRVRFNEVEDWDVPGGDREDDMARYIWKVQVQINGTGAWRLLKKGTIEDKDDDEDDAAGTGRFHFERVHRRHKYRCKMRSVDRWNRRGDWTSWYPSSSGIQIGADTPPAVTIDHYIDLKKRRGVVWLAPEDATDINNDIKRIEIQIAKSSSFSTIVEKHMTAPGHGVYRYLVPRADWDVNHYIRLRTVDGEGDTNAWQPSASGQLLNGVSGDEFDADAPGTVKKHAGPNTPSSWLRCNGDLYSTSLYPALFAEIGYTYGGSGASFAVPDFRRRGARGVGTSQSLGQNEGQVEGERQDGHGSHRDHRHKHHHKRRRKDHSPHGTGQTTGGTPHDHNAGGLNLGAPGATVPRGTAASLAAGPSHTHTVSGNTASGGFHEHQSVDGTGKSIARSPGVPFVSGYGTPEHDLHTDAWVFHEDGDGISIYQDSLVGGGRFDGTSWSAGPTDTGGTDITIDEPGAPSGHKQHGHLRMHFIIKT